jgi:transcriptional regulator with XRE-family HTH domain
VLLDPTTLVEEIDRWLELHLPKWARDPERSEERLEQLAGVSEKTVSRLRSGESRRVRLDVADKLAVVLGIPLELLCPYEEAA